MILNQEAGGYALGQVIRLNGCFRIDGTNNPDVIRDGNSNYILSVVRASAGKFTVTFESGFPVPQRLTYWCVNLSQVAAPATFLKAYLIVDSYSQSTRSFQIQVVKVVADGGDGGTDPDATVIDPDDNDMVSFELVGAINTVGTDAA